MGKEEGVDGLRQSPNIPFVDAYAETGLLETRDVTYSNAIYRSRNTQIGDTHSTLRRSFKDQPVSFK